MAYPEPRSNESQVTERARLSTALSAPVGRTQRYSLNESKCRGSDRKEQRREEQGIGTSGLG